MEVQRSSEKIQKLYEAADNISNTLWVSATDLGDAFPRNYVYIKGDHNAVYVEMSGATTPKTGNLLVLYPDGSIKSGQVKFVVENWTSYYNLKKTEMHKAKEEEVTQYGPALLAELGNKVLNEISDQKNPEKIAKMLQLLASIKDNMRYILEESQVALQEFNGLYAPIDDTMLKAEKILTKLDGEPDNPESHVLEKMKTAFELFTQKQAIIDKYRELSESRDVDQIESATKDLVQTITASGLFPSRTFEYDGMKWYPDWKLQAGSLGARLGCASDRYAKHWVISQDGSVRQASKVDTPLVDNPLELLREAPSIARYFIDRVVKEVYPHIGEKEAGLAF